MNVHRSFEGRSCENLGSDSNVGLFQNGKRGGSLDYRCSYDTKGFHGRRFHNKMGYIADGGHQRSSKMKPMLVKSESEDSGVELASSENFSPSPIGSEHSFSLESFENSHSQSVLDLREGQTEEEPAPLTRKRSHTEVARDTINTSPRSWGVNRKLEQALSRTKRQQRKIRSLIHINSVLQIQDDDNDDETVVPLNSDEDLSAGLHTNTQESLESHVEECKVSTEAEVQIPETKCLDCHVVEEFDELCREAKKVQQDRYKVFSPKPGQGLDYLEQVCRMLEKIAELQQRNLKLQKQKEAVENQLRNKKMETELLVGQCFCGAAEQFQKTPEGSKRHSHVDFTDAPPDAFTPSHLQKRSASDTLKIIQDKDIAALPPSQVTTQFVSAGNLLDDPAREFELPSFPAENRADHAHWGRAKDLITRLRKKEKKPLTSSLSTGSLINLQRQDAVFEESPSSRRGMMSTFMKRRGKNLSVK
ncbi:uncharacterized protein LOC102364603 [Latimeria chalumnae]|uniref:uncharacterized protein LOC102364603 n=1 Tax=Latimeria chalumnae TaxID=7897 RepID=UPI0003C16B4C|nr:PREDICTED: uncharacterized protein LOC102364603 [Latimeria chalumnae]|eukprot:XP_005992650.1 PREDICTED: uncharacterized protein LOC102364603 [Latimeria chalumnae]